MGRASILMGAVLVLCHESAQAQPAPPEPPLPSVTGPMVAPPLGPVALPSGPAISDGPSEGQSLSTLPTSVRPEPLVAALSDRFYESTWYTRQEYFHWNERFDRADFVNEYGLQMTLGYQKRLGIERFRAEMFGGKMRYVGGVQFDDGTSEPLDSETAYLGLRGEYDLMIEPDAWPGASLIAGIGSRFWFRDLKDGATDFGFPVTGYQETWWTIYPYLGIETRRRPTSEPEFYSSARLGTTLFTYEHETWGDAVLYPRFGLTGQAELGLRGQHFFCAGVSEFFTWRQSPVARGVLQPDSSLFTIGLKAGVNF